LAKLASSDIADAIGGDLFRAGLAARSPLLGDPLDPQAKGHPSTWRIGSTSSAPIDVVMTIAGDRRKDVDAYARTIETRLATHLAPDGKPALRKMLKDLKGDALPGDLVGHEHFGFKDGVSQPAIRGRPRSSPDTFIAKRIIDPSSPLALRYGRPGQILLWPGQLLVGQPRQNGEDPLVPLDPLPLARDWVRNGSFMVLRLLAQDVPAFWAQMRSFAKVVLNSETDDAVDWIAARVVGRWRSGAPARRRQSHRQ
jgi:deferrochelatase/peroxidase EfeB